MASMVQVEERDGLDSSGLPIDKKRLLDAAAKSPLIDDAMQPKEGTDGYPVKVPISCPTFEIRSEALHHHKAEGEVDGRRA
jgi:hypothetical protein